MANQSSNFLIFLVVSVALTVLVNMVSQRFRTEPNVSNQQDSVKSFKLPAHVEVLKAIPVPIIRVIDGDTVEVKYQSKLESVRLLRVSAPKKGDRDYEKAKAALKKILHGQDVVLEFAESGLESRGEDGRLRAYLIVQDPDQSINANVEMVRLGHCNYWTKIGEGRYAAEFRRAEREYQARRNKPLVPVGSDNSGVNNEQTLILP